MQRLNGPHQCFGYQLRRSRKERARDVRARWMTVWLCGDYARLVTSVVLPFFLLAIVK